MVTYHHSFSSSRDFTAPHSEIQILFLRHFFSFAAAPLNPLQTFQTQYIQNVQHIHTYMHTYIHTCIAKTVMLELIWVIYCEGQSDGSGEDDVSILGSTHERGLRRLADRRSGLTSDGSFQQDLDSPSTTTTLWSNSSRYILSICNVHIYIYIRSHIHMDFLT